MRRLKSFIIAIILLFSLSACSKTEYNIDINSNGEVSLTHKILISKDDFDNVNNILGITSENYDYNGYSVKKINQDDMIGYKISRNFGRIDSLSSKRSNIVELTEYTTDDFPIKMLFEKKNRFLYKTYVGHFSIDLTDMDSVIKYLPFEKGISYKTNNDSGIIKTSTSSDTIRQLNNNVEAIVSLNAFGIIKNTNAHANTNSKYIWELEFGKVNEVYFEVDMINRSVFFIVLLLILLLIGVCVVIQKHKNIKWSSNITLRESLHDDYGKEVEDIYSSFETKKKREYDIDSINYKISGSGTNIKGYQNQRDIDRLKEKYSKIGKKKEIVSLNEQIDPKFRLVDDQVKEELNKEENKKIKDENKKFIK